MSFSPLITVAVNYYNDKKFLSECINSILNQTLTDFELILFNHASTDGSRDIARSFNDPRIIHVDAPKNLGAGSSYNFRYTMPLINGKWFKGFCADDIMKSDCLENLGGYAEQHADKDLIFGNLEFVDTVGKDLKQDWFHYYKNFSVDMTEIDLMKIFAAGSNVLPCPAAMFKTDLLQKIKKDNSLTIRADIWLWLRCLLVGAKVGFCDKIVGFYRRHDYQESYFDPEILRRRSEYEKAPLLSCFFDMKNVETVKAVFPDSPYVDRLTDPQNIPFYVAEYFFRKDGYSFAYNALFEMMLDDETLERLDRVFGFGVLELRKLYAFRTGKTPWKKRVYATPPNKLTIVELVYLLAKKSLKAFVSLLSLRFLRRGRV